MRNYATQMDAAKRGIVTPEIETVAKKENRPVEFIMERVAKGTIAIPANINHKSLSAEAVGDGTRVKINVNLGISGDCKDYEMELRKVRMAVDMGAESIMDLSNYGKTNTFRKQLIDMVAGEDRHRADVRRDGIWKRTCSRSQRRISSRSLRRTPGRAWTL